MPADGVKGKTWGPSSAGGGSKVRPNIVDESGQNRWSKSAPSLEKSPRTLAAVPTVTSVPELGKGVLMKENLMIKKDQNRKLFIKKPHIF